MSTDSRWMAAAVTLAERGTGRTWPNPNVGCVIVQNDIVVGRGWTQPGGRPHAEAVALAQAGDAARGADLYTTLEPCAHVSPRGPTCADLIATSGVGRVIFAVRDPDPRTDGKGAEKLRAAGIIVVEAVAADLAKQAMGGFLMRQWRDRPFVTLKLALSVDGCIALANGTSRWITGAAARAHAHLERAQSDSIIVGRGTYDADAPRLEVRLAGLESRCPQRVLLTSGNAPAGWTVLAAPQDIGKLAANSVLVEGGAGAASSFLAADLVDRLLIYRAPVLIGGGKPGLRDIGLVELAEAHDRWRSVDSRRLGPDRLDIYMRLRD